jgi:ABC-2 type transport system ATP-binding protein
MALWREVSALHEEGTTVFLTTQYLEEAEQLADRVGIIARGKLEAEGTPQSLKERVKDPTVHVELADPADAEAARQALAGLGTVEPPNERTPSRIALQTPAGKGAIAPVIRALDEHGVVVEFVEVETPTLDDVFVAVTGAHLEGAAAAEEAVA